jgi:SAM-dependent methyltransferase
MNESVFTLDILNFLISEAGHDAMSLAADLDPYKPADAEKLRKICSADEARAVFEIVELRRRAKNKFSRAQWMFFDRKGYEQSSGEVLADYKASRIREKYNGGRIYDLCCGVGGDAISLASVGPVTAVDLDPVRLKMAELNLSVYNHSDKAEFLCADINKIDLAAELFHLDPDQRTGKKRRSFVLEELSPSKDEIDLLLKKIPDGVIKFSPAVDYSSLPWSGEVELISHKGQCRQLVLWTGKFAAARRRATTLPEKSSIDSSLPERLEVRDIGAYLYDPDPTVSRLRLLGQLAGVMTLDFLSPGQVVLTSNELLSHPLARAYRVEDVMPFREDKVRKYFKEKAFGPVTVKPRGTDVNVDKLSKSLSGKSGPEKHLFLLRLDKRVLAVVTTLEG